jgi:hypothetical protein
MLARQSMISTQGPTIEIRLIYLDKYISGSRNWTRQTKERKKEINRRRNLE